MRVTLLTFLLVCVVLTCPDKDERCIACNGTKCAECADGYLGPTGVCVAPTTHVDFCAQYKSDGVCSYCVSGYYVTTQGKCVKIPIEGCAELASATQCAICSHSVLVKNGICNTDNKCGIANCNLCLLRNGIEVCAKCNDGYSVLINKGAYSCKPETSTNKHCLYLNSNNSNVCAVCDYNFYMKNQTCEKSSQYKLESSAGFFGALVSLCLVVLFK